MGVNRNRDQNTCLSGLASQSDKWPQQRNTVGKAAAQILLSVRHGRHRHSPALMPAPLLSLLFLCECIDAHTRNSSQPVCVSVCAVPGWTANCTSKSCTVGSGERLVQGTGQWHHSCTEKPRSQCSSDCGLVTLTCPVPRKQG